MFGIFLSSLIQKFVLRKSVFRLLSEFIPSYTSVLIKHDYVLRNSTVIVVHSIFLDNLHLAAH
jgi:hypothetical protein